MDPELRTHERPRRTVRVIAASAVAGAVAVGLVVAPTAPAHAEDDARTRLQVLAQQWDHELPSTLDVERRIVHVIDGVKHRHDRRSRVIDDGRRRPRAIDTFINREGGKVVRSELHGFRNGFLYTYPDDAKLPKRLSRLARKRAGDRSAKLARARDRFGPDGHGRLTNGRVDEVRTVARWSAPASILGGWTHRAAGSSWQLGSATSQVRPDGSTVFTGTLVPRRGTRPCEPTFRAVERDGRLVELESRHPCEPGAPRDVSRLVAVGDAVRVPGLKKPVVNHFRLQRKAHRIAQRRLLQPLLVKARKKLNRKARRTGEPVRTKAVNRTVRKLSPVDWGTYKPRRGVHLRYSGELRGRMIANKKGRAVACLKPYRKTRSPLPRMKRCRAGR